jgi:membrane protease subunit (stomatin/prohibitin family)
MCVSVFLYCVVLYVGRGHASGRFPVQLQKLLNVKLHVRMTMDVEIEGTFVEISVVSLNVLSQNSSGKAK